MTPEHAAKKLCEILGYPEDAVIRTAALVGATGTELAVGLLLDTVLVLNRRLAEAERQLSLARDRIRAIEDVMPMEWREAQPHLDAPSGP